jgi:aminopeptidase N
MKTYQIKLLILFSTLVLLSCSNKAEDEITKQSSAIKRAEVSYLEEDYARLRSKQVKDVVYKLSFKLSANKPLFTGREEISFDLLHNNHDLTIDFSEGNVNKILVNGRPVKIDYNKWFITIDKSLLKTGPQLIAIEFSHPYSKTGSGLYRFTDPEDNKVYIYSDLEPYDANRIFPSFDQPDLKASYEMLVEAPHDWIVVTSKREIDVLREGLIKSWIFPASDKFSSYIFSLHAGPYKVWESMAGDIPLRLMARQTIAEFVEEQDWFEVSQQGFDFFQKYYDVEYPFDKYDQLIVPDFNSGAMENVGAVTFSEGYIKRGSYTIEDRERIASVILHEMAHMWFGNLVTMRWWNGLWLNESFATYMAYLAATEATEFTQAWHSFFTRKLWGYNTDEQVTNHPIDLPVNNTDSGFANFDGITYSKGGAVLKQLSYLVEPEVFRQGVSQYLKDKSYANSELDDFISSMARVAGRDLDEWTRQWLYTKGTNRITTDYQCEAGKISGMQVQQESKPTDDQELREHRLQLGLYKKLENEQMELLQAFPVTVTGASTDISGLIGSDCPDFVYPNYDDWAFVKVGLPEKEVDLLKKNINGFSDPMMRSMLWRNLWEAVRDAKLPLTDYANIVLANIGAEENLKTLGRVTRTIHSTIAYLYLFQIADMSSQEWLQNSFEKLAWEKIQSTKGQADLQKIWFDHYAGIVHSQEGLARLKTLLNGETSIAGFVLDQDRRWKLINRLSAHAFTGIETILEKELVNDPSSTGEKAYIAAQAAAPNLENKQKWLAEIQNDNTDMALAKLRAAMGALYPAYHVEYRKALLDQVLTPLGELDGKKEQQYLRFYTAYLLKGDCSASSNAALQKAIDENKTFSLGTTKKLKIALQENQRCMDMKALLVR